VPALAPEARIVLPAACRRVPAGQDARPFLSPDYARTRRFYESRGFRPLEEIKGFWNEENPCLIMVKHLAGPGTVSP
jgi:hypothetical protein